MENLKIDSTQQSPEICFDITSNTYLIEGVSMPEDAVGFYKPVFEWLDKFTGNSDNTANFEMKLKYFNTASAKMIIEFCKKVSEKNNSRILRTYEEDDEDLEEIGNDLKELIGDAFVANPVEEI